MKPLPGGPPRGQPVPPPPAQQPSSSAPQTGMYVCMHCLCTMYGVQMYVYIYIIVCMYC